MPDASDPFDAMPNQALDTSRYSFPRPPYLHSNQKPPPPRSKSSIELAGFAAQSPRNVPAFSSSVTPSPFLSQGSTSTSEKRNNASVWHKSAFDMIQDDFPRTPSPMFSSLLSNTQNFGTNPDLGDDTFRSRLTPSDRRNRIASTTSLNFDLDRVASVVADEPAIVPKPVLSSRNPSRHHRRSMSVNWADDLTGLSEDTRGTPRKSSLVSSPSITSFLPYKSSPSATVGNATTSIMPRPRAPVNTVQPCSPPQDNSPVASIGGSAISTSPSHANPMNLLPSHALNPRMTPGGPVNVSSYSNVHLTGNDRNSQRSFDDCLGSNPYDYLYGDSDNGVRPPFSAAGAQFPASMFPDSQTNVPGPSNTFEPLPHSFNNGHPTNVFPGMGLFPSPFTNGPAGVNGNMAAPVYSQSFRDELTAADSLKTMSLQMAAFLSAQQQLYAAQVAQMAAIAGNPAFAIPNSASLGRAHPASGGHCNGPSQGMQMRSQWDGRDSGGSYRNISRPRHQQDQHRSNGFGYAVNGKKLNGTDSNGKGKSIRGNRRGHRGFDEIGVSGIYKNIERGSSGASSACGASDNSNQRSALLEEFRLTSSSIGRGLGSGTEMNTPNSYSNIPGSSVQRYRDWRLSELENHIVEFATDQHGSRFIQQKLESASEEERKAILDEALYDAQRLMTDVFGNYVVQKLLEHGGEVAVAAIAQELEGRMLSLSLHMYGCRVVQKALEVLEKEQRSRLVRELDGHVLKCIRDQNGNHVIQKCVELVEADSAQFIVNAVQGQAVALAGHSYGCRVVQRILEHGAPHQKAPIMIEIMSAIPELIKDQYGNYVIQHVVEHGSEDEREVVMNLVRGQIFELSQHKFASNVVERCLQFGTLEERRVLIDILIGSDIGLNGGSPLQTLVRDQFGNYVVQRVLDVALSPQRDQVVNLLKAQVQTIKKYSYGKHIIARLEEHHFHHHHHHHHHHHRTTSSLDNCGGIPEPQEKNERVTMPVGSTEARSSGQVGDDKCAIRALSRSDTEMNKTSSLF